MADLLQLLEPDFLLPHEEIFYLAVVVVDGPNKKVNQIKLTL